MSKNNKLIYPNIITIDNILFINKTKIKNSIKLNQFNKIKNNKNKHKSNKIENTFNLYINDEYNSSDSDDYDSDISISALIN